MENFKDLTMKEIGTMSLAYVLNTLKSKFGIELDNYSRSEYHGGPPYYTHLYLSLPTPKCPFCGKEW